jgi:hypothetical protein
VHDILKSAAQHLQSFSFLLMGQSLHEKNDPILSISVVNKGSES